MFPLTFSLSVRMSTPSSDHHPQEINLNERACNGLSENEETRGGQAMRHFAPTVTGRERVSLRGGSLRNSQLHMASGMYGQSNCTLSNCAS